MPVASLRATVGLRLERFLIRQSEDWSRWQVITAGVGLVALIGVLDFVTGPQISSSLFYLLPVLLVALLAGQGAGVAMAAAATATWLAVDLLPPAVYGHLWIPFWNALMRLGVFLVVVWLVSDLRALNESLERRVRDRTARLQAEVHERLELEKRILEISEREQERIGQDLHDGLCQQLVGTAFSANLLQQRLSELDMRESADAARVSASLDDCITQARGLARGLYPVRLEEEGLVNALQELMERASERSGVDCMLECGDVIGAIAHDVAIHLYRIAQEAVNNALHHACATRIKVRLDDAGECLDLKIEDDGTGFDPVERRAGAMGLHIMAYRARLIGCRLEVSRAGAGGTRVHCFRQEDQSDVSTS